MTDKKQRGKNFTTEEELLLVDLLILGIRLFEFYIFSLKIV